MKRFFFTFLICIAFLKIAFGQDFQYGAISNEDLDMKAYVKDTSAHAVVLREFGKTTFIVASDNYYKIRFEYHIKIKIFNDKGFDSGSVEIPAYFDNETYENVDDISGTTFYKDENGNVQRADLDQKNVYSEKVSKHWINYKFAMPALKKGCIIEYKYIIESPYWETLHKWEFQTNIPKIYSEYEVHIPAFWVYNASLRGSLKLTKSSAVVESKCFESRGASCDCSLLDNAMADIPAFDEEDYMTSGKNFKSAINFEEVEFTNPSTNEKHVRTKEWKDVDYQLKNDSYFGSQLKKKSLFKDRLVPVITDKATDLEKAKAVYSYIQTSIKWNERSNGIYSIDGVSKTLDTHSGSVGDINISLIAALNAAGLNASAVLLSTRDNGTVNPLYPVISDFDYVVARVDIGDQNYLLDATDPLLSFGILPFKCLNDKGRVFSLDKPSYWMSLDLPQKEKTTRSFDLTLQEDGKVKGTITNYYSGYEAYKKRKSIKKFNSTDEYVEDLVSKLPKFKILKYNIINIDSLNMPLGETFEVEINLIDKATADKPTFNPFIMDRITTNPFKLAERSYPVDWGMASEERSILTMHLPPQYEVELPPQPISVILPNNGGKFLSSYDAVGNTFTFSDIIQFNKSIYSPAEYPYLKELYNKIISTEKAEMVFRKKQ